MDGPTATHSHFPGDEIAEGAPLTLADADQTRVERGQFSAARIRKPRVSPRAAGFVAGGAIVVLIAYGAAVRLRSDSAVHIGGHPIPSRTAEAAAIRALPPPDLLRPLTPEEAAKENAERPFAARPDTPASRFVLKTDAEDRARAITCLAQAIYYEAAGEGTDGGRAVAQIVLNRLRHPGYPTTVCGVVYEGADRPTGCQLSFTCDGSMQRIPVPALWTRSREIAEQALEGRVFAPVGHATHYHADYVLPYWADSLDKSVQIGRHIFYRLRNSLGDARAFSQRYGGTEPAVREPGPTIVIPATAETAQLASALISDNLQDPAPAVEKASTVPSSPLLVDSMHGTLLADGESTPVTSKQAKSDTECPAGADRKQLKPLGATDMRASAASPSC